MINILMTGAGAPGAPGIIKCLKQEGSLNLFLCDSNPDAVGRFLHDGVFKVVPKANDVDFIKVIKQICSENNISVIMPLVTLELFVFAKYKAELEEIGIKVLVSDEKALNIANNKAYLYEFLNAKGVDFIPSFLKVNTYDEFNKSIKELDYPSVPVCFKPSVSNGSRGFRIINSTVNEFDLLFNYKPDNTYILLEKIQDILRENKFPELIVSEYLPGEEYSVDCIANNGKPVLIIPRLRRKMLGGISTAGEIIMNQELIVYSKEIIEKIGLHGNIGIQFKRAASGQFKLLEINPRVQGTIVSILGAGVNMPLIAVKQELGLRIEEAELNVKWGTNFIRYWDEVFY
ncbi:hypothetical protein C3K47_01755 [Solitalea longa]|uniref:ATP-grasp domain-containing protein n=1 Tax=Solitalea longa TaxID=2079460 RepID=A0A2S5A9R0_9SPHI|nr:ATP-grasp domain-containing protein [Solitalea longa]POY39244.1 hypothetical protein C3K47_01755 [Solitalea longa]